MKRMYIAAILISMTLLLASCSSKNYVINSEYQNKTFDNQVIVIPDVEETKFYDVLGIFSEQEKGNIEDAFKSSINNNIASYIIPESNTTKVYNVKYKTEPKLQEKSFKVGKELLILDIPQGMIDVGEENNAFILLLEKPSITIMNKEKETSDPAKNYSLSSSTSNSGTSTSEYNNAGVISVSEAKAFNTVVNLSIKYILYDNKNEQVAYYGLSEYHESFRSDDDIKNILDKGVQSIAKEIISNSPLKKSE